MRSRRYAEHHVATRGQSGHATSAVQRSLAGMPLFTVSTMAVQSLFGPLAFGLVLAAVVVALARRTSH